MSASVHSNFAGRIAERLGSNSALLDASTLESFDAEAIRTSIADFAAAFSAAGLRFGDRILIGCSLHPLSSIAYLGAMFGGLVPVPVSEAGLASSGEALCRKAGARALWTERVTARGWAEALRLIKFYGRMQGPNASVACAVREDNPAALMPTSGSTGEPKLVSVTHGNLIANTEAIIRSQHLGSDESAMLILPVSYCFGASVLHTHLYQGGAVVFDSRFMFPDKVLSAIADHRCTTFAGVPTVYNILARRSNIAKLPVPTLRRLLQAGGALAVERIEQIRSAVPHAQFFVMYGQTEATSRISCLPPHRLGDKLGSAGMPLDNLSIRILDPDGAEVPMGQTGELWVSGPSVCPGYYDDLEETRRKYHQGWLATGDIASKDAEGFLWITGRKSEFVKMRGIRVSFAEIESTVSAVRGVSECAALALPHAEAGEAVALYVVVVGAADEVCASIRRSVPKDWVCDSVRLVQALPRNAHGKLLRPRLAELPCVAYPLGAAIADRARPQGAPRTTQASSM